ncbi:hypothetical protein [Roseibium sp. RKSG952]|uniref:hypothetical protein n=1 Tax=Roseibium sp. RKSG952 TaxID=2529384 RepID=UPI0012BD6DD4|nr:hypothetical protein [Roseibium sp. RKSG952]MTH95540.1 hypothetical protein [Roseibium sp. RKSG952]
MFYIVENTYVGPNQNEDSYLDCNTIVIQEEPALTNMSREPRTEGWCGTTNDWSVTAHGAYESLSDAQAAIGRIFGEVRFAETERGCGIVETYKPGKFEPLSVETTGIWAVENDDITADTSDERIEELVNEYEAIANGDGQTLHSCLERDMRAHRDNLRDERDNDEADD